MTYYALHTRDRMFHYITVFTNKDDALQAGRRHSKEEGWYIKQIDKPSFTMESTARIGMTGRVIASSNESAVQSR